MSTRGRLHREVLCVRNPLIVNPQERRGQRADGSHLAIFSMHPAYRRDVLVAAAAASAAAAAAEML